MEKHLVVEDNGGGLAIYTLKNGVVADCMDSDGVELAQDYPQDELQAAYDHPENKVIAELSDGDWDGVIIASYPDRCGAAGRDWLKMRGGEER